MIGVAILLLAVWLYLVCRDLKNTARGRKYKSGTGWCFWRWSDVESEYILRLHVVKTPWFAICLHWIQKPDAEPWLHDHPASFLSLILRGGYTEWRKRGGDTLGSRTRTWFNWVRAGHTDRRRILAVRPHTLTLCFMGPKTREWGFHVGDLLQPAPTIYGPAGWIHWKDYYARLRDGEDMRCGPLGLFDKVLMAHYTEEHIGVLVGSPIGKFVDEDTRELDTGAPDDFIAEPPTDPYGTGPYGKGPFGGPK